MMKIIKRVPVTGSVNLSESLLQSYRSYGTECAAVTKPTDWPGQVRMWVQDDPLPPDVWLHLLTCSLTETGAAD